jgi:hypothetical protein
MQMHFLIYPLLLHIWCWFMCVRGSYELKMCCHQTPKRGSDEFLWANYIYLANSCVVIKHQKGGDWKSISWVNDILVFVVNTHLNVKDYWLMTQSLSTPQKWKDQSIEDLDFRFCILVARWKARVKSNRTLSYTPLQYGWENYAEILSLGIFWAETLGLRAGDFGM